MKLKNKRILTIVSDDFDDLEAWYPILRLREAGAICDVAGELSMHDYQGKYGLKLQSNKSFDEINILDYDAILVPGGWAPDYLRRLDPVLNFIKVMNENKRVIGQICHAGWVLSSADILKGVTVTSTPGIKHDLINAGATWVDTPAIADGHIISARRPPDLPAYLPLLIEALSK